MAKRVLTNTVLSQKQVEDKENKLFISMKNIQAQYKDLLEGKMPKHNFMRNVRMEFPQYVSPTNSYDDAVRILKSKRILSEVEAKGVFGYDPNAENPPKPGIDQLNYYQVYHGIQYELAQVPEITDENYIKARKKVVDTILKDPDAYKNLQLANFKAVKEMDQDLKMKEVKEDNKVDKPNALKVIKKDAKANTEDTLGKKEKKKAKIPKGVAVMTQTPKKTKGVEVMEVPGKEKVKALKESIVGEMTKLNPTHEVLGVGSRVKKKDNSLVGEIVEWDGHTAAVKDDKDGKVTHIQGNVLTKKDVPAKEEKEAYKNNTADDHQWANGKVKKEVEESREEKMDKLREKLTKVIKKELDEDMFTKGSGTNAQTVTASNPTSKNALKSKGFTQVPNTVDIKSI